MHDEAFSLETYYPIFLYLGLLLLFVVAVLIMAHTIGPRKNTPVKLMVYESGMDPIGDARQRFDVKFYLVAIMFLVFDVELLFLYPWAVVAYSVDPATKEPWIPTVLQRPVFFSVLAFIALLLIAYIYDWRKGVFQWR
jgi:NADH:ubiquinone oxidoreductase subunit 3 (subunit A)